MYSVSSSVSKTKKKSWINNALNPTYTSVFFQYFFLLFSLYLCIFLPTVFLSFVLLFFTPHIFYLFLQSFFIIFCLNFSFFPFNFFLTFFLSFPFILTFSLSFVLFIFLNRWIFRSRMEDLRKNFPGLPAEEMLMGDYSCALQKVQFAVWISKNKLSCIWPSLDKLKKKNSGVYNVPCNLIFFPTLIFEKFYFLPQNFSPLPLFPLDNLPYSLDIIEQMSLLPLTLFFK